MKAAAHIIRPLTLMAAAWLMLCAGLLHGQSAAKYFNEWYRPGQSYIKLLAAADGPYRVYKTDLDNAGVTNLPSLDPDNIQVFYRGKEISILVKETVTGDLDYFEFEGRRNDGAIDSLMYRNPYAPFNVDPGQQPNIHNSFFTDTSAYFVTWDSIGTKRRASFRPTGFAGKVPETTYRYRILEEFIGEYYQGGGGKSDANHVINPDYITGEGYMSKEFELGDDANFLIRVMTFPGYVAGGSIPTKWKVRACGVNGSDLHDFQMSLNSTPIYRDTTTGITITTREFETTTLNLPSVNTIMRFQAMGNGVRPDKQRLAWFSCEYNRNFNLNAANRVLVRDWAAPDTAYFQFFNADVTSEAWIWDPANNLHIEGIVSADTLRFLVPPASQPRDLYLYTDKALKSTIIRPSVSLNNLSDVNAGAEMLIITNPIFSNSAGKYAQYRDTTSVNPLSTKVVYVDQIIDEFGYGSLNTMAIKNFVQYALENWNTKPKYVFLWGKGQYNPRQASQYNFVPSFGNPASDYEYVTNFRRDTVNFIPEAAIGRLSIISDQQGLDYLEKVDVYEHTPYDKWMKEAVFLGGGQYASEQNSIRDALLHRFMPFVVAPPLNGNVHWYQKTNNGIETNSPTVSSHTRIDRGVGLIQFFGHSSTNIFDVDILDANRYTNFGKFPFMIAFGCHGGDFIQTSQSFGERFVAEPNRGSIGYLANSTEGFLGELRRYGTLLHQTMFGSHYRQPVGEVIRETIRQYSQQGNAFTNILAANHSKQLNLQGDPSITLNFPEKPDLHTQPSMAWFTPEPLSTQSPIFSLNLAVRNDGRSFQDSFIVRISQRLPSGVIFQHPDTLMPPVGHLDTLLIPLVNSFGIDAAGLNTFTIHVDALDSLLEYREDNNLITIQTLIQGSTPALIYPYEYALVGTDTLTLVAAKYAIDDSITIRYSFEIDTVHHFISGFRIESGPVIGTSVSGRWTLPFTLQEGQVYYWRSRFTDSYPVSWSEGSFKYKSGKYGWAQSRAPQMYQSIFDGVNLDTTSREWSFPMQATQIHAYILPPFGLAAYFFGPNSSAGGPPAGIMYTTFDQFSFVSSVKATQFGDWRYAAPPSLADPNTILDIVNTIMEMKEGDYFLMVTNNDAKFSYWLDSYVAAFSQVGIDPASIASLENGDQAIVFGKKGAPPGSWTAITQPNIIEGGPKFDLLSNVSNTTSSGEATSTRIGPAKQWDEMNFEWHSFQPFEQDSLYMTVSAIDDQDNSSVIAWDLQEGLHPITGIDDEQDLLILTGEFKDKVHLSPPQLDVWEVYYSPVADLAVDPIVAFSVPDTIVEGQVVDVEVGFRNLTRFSTDSVLAQFSLMRADRSEVMLGLVRTDTLGGFGQASAKMRFHSAGKGLEEGLVNLVFEVNPGPEQREQHLFNNRILFPIYVIKDNVGPILNVTIDGKMLMEGDYVQPDPEIVIQVNDENPYLPVTISDSTYFIWFGQERTYNFNPQILIDTDTRLSGTAGRLPENKAKLTFLPGRLPDGEYTLAVQSKDFSGNPSGEDPYIIHFIVESDKAISEVLPYPNPFSTSTRFAYTLTGDEKPYVFELQIFTISGRLVKVIDLMEMGEVHFGKNLTTFAWDGRDEFGDLLANGLYLYRTNVKFHDRYGVKQMETGLGDYFNNGFGKMYILR